MPSTHDCAINTWLYAKVWSFVYNPATEPSFTNKIFQTTCNCYHWTYEVLQKGPSWHLRYLPSSNWTPWLLRSLALKERVLMMAVAWLSARRNSWWRTEPPLVIVLREFYSYFSSFVAFNWWSIYLLSSSLSEMKVDTFWFSFYTQNSTMVAHPMYAYRISGTARCIASARARHSILYAYYVYEFWQHPRQIEPDHALNHLKRPSKTWKLINYANKIHVSHILGAGGNLSKVYVVWQPRGLLRPTGACAGASCRDLSWACLSWVEALLASIHCTSNLAQCRQCYC